jgi:hypothetical protein
LITSVFITSIWACKLYLSARERELAFFTNWQPIQLDASAFIVDGVIALENLRLKITLVSLESVLF